MSAYQLKEGAYSSILAAKNLSTDAFTRRCVSSRSCMIKCNSLSRNIKYSLRAGSLWLLAEVGNVLYQVRRIPRIAFTIVYSEVWKHKV